MTDKAKIKNLKVITSCHTLQVGFAKDKTYLIELLEYIRNFPALKPLEDLALFSKAQVGEWGYEVTWGNNIELAATTLYRLALEQAGEVMPFQNSKVR